MDLSVLLQLADRHHLIGRDDALRAGISRSAWHRAHAAGVLDSLHPGWSRIAALRPPSGQKVAAAVKAAGPGAMASHRSAALLWGAQVVGDRPIDVTVPDRARYPRLEAVQIHRPTDLGDLRPVIRLGIPVTSPLRTSLDIGAVWEPPMVGLVVEHFVLMRSFGLATLRSAMQRHSRQGRMGLGPLRLLLDDLALGDKPPDSVLEPAMARLLSAHGLPPATFHHLAVTSGGAFELDFAYSDERVDIEVDGWAAHASRRAFEADRARDAYLTGAGWVVLRFTWFQVHQRPSWVAARIIETLTQRGSRRVSSR